MERKDPKILTTNDIRRLAQDWTLAGDVGLLAYLEQFSQNIISKTQEVQEKFDELVDDYEELYARVGNITNQFLALQNCQFVENRVYDEETPTEERPEAQGNNDTEREKLLLMHYKEAVEIGVKLLDSHFLEVQLPPNSDSDEEDEISTGNSIIWKPKNPYGTKKFPFLIGSADWWAYDHVGLATEEQVLDMDKIISESDSDLESVKSIEKAKSSSSSMENIKSVLKQPLFLQSSSSENLFIYQKFPPVGNQDSEGKKTETRDKSFLPDFEKEEASKEILEEKPKEGEPALPTSDKVDNVFTHELMAKLVTVTNEEPLKIEEKENLFDETDDSGDLFSRTVKNVPVDSKRLFFNLENDDELFKGEKELFSEGSLLVRESEAVEKEVPKLQENRKSTETKTNLLNDLFHDLEDEEYNLFATGKPSLPPTEETTQKTTSEPVSAWNNGQTDEDFFNSSEFFDIQTEQHDLFSGTNKKPTDLFDEPFGFSDTKTNLFSQKVPVDDDSTHLLDKPKPPDTLSISSSRSSLFDDVTTSKSRLGFVFEKEETSEDSLFVHKGGNPPKEKQKSLLFDDSDNDDLFGAVTKSDLFSNTEETQEKPFIEDVDDLFLEKPTKPKPPSSLSLKGSDKLVGKLNIPDNLKHRFESAAKQIATGGRGIKLTENKPDESLNIQPSSLLKCPSKDRVKIPGRRRPQSRKARQEAIRNSGTWDRTPSPTPIQSKDSPVVSPSTDEEDFFKVPELDMNLEKEDQTMFQSKVDETLLFDEAPVLSPITPKKGSSAKTEVATLFGDTHAFTLDDDDDEDLFKTLKTQEKSKKSLFTEDDNDDTDLFRGKTPSKPPDPQEKKCNERKEKSNLSFIDPLGLIKN